MTRMLKGAELTREVLGEAQDRGLGHGIWQPHRQATIALIDDTLTIEPNFCVFINGIARHGCFTISTSTCSMSREADLNILGLKKRLPHWQIASNRV